jgi:hypothetical protein
VCVTYVSQIVTHKVTADGTGLFVSPIDQSLKGSAFCFQHCDEFHMLRQQLYAGIGTRLFLGVMCMVRVLSTCGQPTTVPQRLQRNTSQIKDSGTGGDGGRYCRGSGACSNPLCRRDVRSLLQRATPFNALQCLEMPRTYKLLGQASASHASHARQQCACWTYTSGHPDIKCIGCV